MEKRARVPLLLALVTSLQGMAPLPRLLWRLEHVLVGIGCDCFVCNPSLVFSLFPKQQWYRVDGVLGPRMRGLLFGEACQSRAICWLDWTGKRKRKGPLIGQGTSPWWWWWKREELKVFDVAKNTPGKRVGMPWQTRGTSTRKGGRKTTAWSVAGDVESVRLLRCTCGTIRATDFHRRWICWWQPLREEEWWWW
jgi:hypothetical protein